MAKKARKKRARKKSKANHGAPTPNALSLDTRVAARAHARIDRLG